MAGTNGPSQVIVPCPPGYTTIGNNFRDPLPASSVIANPQDGMELYRWNSAAQAYDDPYQYFFGIGWFSPSDPNPPIFRNGEGWWFGTQVPTQARFSGVPGTVQAKPRPPNGFYFLSGQRPQPSRFQEVTGFAPQAGDKVYKYDLTVPALPANPAAAPSSTHVYNGSSWDVEPILDPGKAMWVQLGGTNQPPTNTPPVVTWVQPANGASFPAGSSISLRARATDSDGTVSFVDFFANASRLARVSFASSNIYTFRWSNAPAGQFQLHAEAVDNAGARGISGSVQITVRDTNQPPSTNVVIVPCPPGYTTIGNNFRDPLPASSVIANPQDGMTLYRWNSAAQRYDEPYQYIFGFGWLNPSDPNEPIFRNGEGWWFGTQVPTQARFSGVPGTIQAKPRPPNGFYFLSGQRPQPSRFQEVTGYPPQAGDKVYKYDVTVPALPANPAAAPSSTHVYNGSSWDVEPILDPGKAMWVELGGPPPTNRAPVARIDVENAVTFLETLTILAVGGDVAVVVLDGSRSFDSDGDALQYLWSVGSPPTPFASGIRVTNELETGSYDFQLEVSDGQLSATASTNLAVLTPCDAIGLLIIRIAESAHERKDKRPLISSLEMSCREFGRGDIESGIQRLEAFQQKVTTRLGSVDPAFAELLINEAQTLIDAITGQ